VEQCIYFTALLSPTGVLVDAGLLCDNSHAQQSDKQETQYKKTDWLASLTFYRFLCCTTIPTTLGVKIMFGELVL
jgi:hypothetical protein